MEPATSATISRNQSVLDASVPLLQHRLNVIRECRQGGDRWGSELVDVGGDASNWLMSRSTQWTHLLSTRSFTSAKDLRRSLPNNRKLRRNGLKMVSVFDERGTSADAGCMLNLEPDAAYYFADAPLAMRIIDQRVVVLAGSEAPLTLLVTHSPVVLTAAMTYWKAVMVTARPCRSMTESDRGLTERQRSVVELLRGGQTDQQIAAVLDVSQRTISSEVATIMQVFGVCSRFALGFSIGASAHAADTAV